MCGLLNLWQSLLVWVGVGEQGGRGADSHPLGKKAKN